MTADEGLIWNDFVEFWNAWPTHWPNQTPEKAWPLYRDIVTGRFRKCNVSPSPEILNDAARYHAKSHAGRDRKYRKGPVAFLAGGKWAATCQRLSDWKE